MLSHGRTSSDRPLADHVTTLDGEIIERSSIFLRMSRTVCSLGPAVRQLWRPRMHSVASLLRSPVVEPQWQVNRHQGQVDDGARDAHPLLGEVASVNAAPAARRSIT